jgi:GNAT superfamily N-acetyltransferase
MNTTQPDSSITLRNDIRPGDLGSIVQMHGTLYAREYGFDPTFEAYVAGPLSQFILSHGQRDRIWLAERASRLVGCIAIVAANEREAQLRWFLVDPSARGVGLGKRLMNEAISFCRQMRYESIFLWTVSALTVAGKLYRSCGFERVESSSAKRWGVDVVEEKFVLGLG